MEKKPKSETEKLVPVEREVKIAGEVYKVRPFSVKDIVFFTRDLFEGLAALKAKYPDLGSANDKTTMIEYIPALLDESPRLFGLMARAVDKDREWLESCTDLVGVSELFANIVEINDFGAIISNFKRGWSKLKTQVIA